MLVLVFGVEALLMIFREGSGVAALACCRAAPDSLLLLIRFLCYYVEERRLILQVLLYNPTSTD